MKKIFFSLFFPFLVVLAGCKTDVDVTGDYQDITVVYGLLSQKDSITYLKINKAFLGDGNAMTYAQVEDSSSYHGNIEVSIQDWTLSIAGDPSSDTVNLVQTITFDTTTVYDKEPGQFYYPKQVVYKAVTHDLLNPDHLYKLIIRNKTTGKQITGKTILVGNFTIKSPGTYAKTIGFDPTGNTVIKWLSAKNGRRYQVTMRFNYKELSSSTSTDTVFRYLEWSLPKVVSQELTGNEQLESSFANSYFFDLLKTKLTKVEGMVRYAGKVEMFVSAAADEFNTFMDVSEPSTGIIQEKPEYTNISNGIGLFSSRFQVKRSFILVDETESMLPALDLGFIYIPGK